MIDAAQVAHQADLVELVRAAGVTLHRAGSEWRGACPLHNGRNPNGFGVYRSDGKWRWKCFTGDCGNGDAVDFVMKHQGLSYVDALRNLGGEGYTDPRAAAQAAAERQARQIAEFEEQMRKMQATLDGLKRDQVWVRYYANLDESPYARQLWRQRGIPDTWQGVYQLGYDPDHSVWYNGEWYHTPTLTIPVFDTGWQIQNVRHRLLNPPAEGDKYRPERAGLPAQLFLAQPDRAIDGKVVVIEGEIKTMVSYITLDNPTYQMVGLMGKNSWHENVSRFEKAEQIIIVPDPDAEGEARKMAAALGKERCSIATVPVTKVDDAINQGLLDGCGLQKILDRSTRVR